MNYRLTHMTIYLQMLWRRQINFNLHSLLPLNNQHYYA